MTPEPKDPKTPKPPRLRCAQCGTRTATVRLALYPDKPQLVTDPICDRCALLLMAEHIGAQAVTL